MNLPTDARELGRKYGKKLLVHTTEAARGQYVKTDIRFKEEEGKFYAIAGADVLSDVDVNALKAEVDKLIKASVQLDYDCYIEVNQIPDHGPTWGNREPVAVALEYQIIYVSRQKLHRENQSSYRLMKRGWFDSDKGIYEPSGTESAYHDYQKTLIPFTPERLATIERVRDAILAARANLRALLNTAEAGALLDAFNPGHLLEAPKSE